jgi:Fic family protein
MTDIIITTETEAENLETETEAENLETETETETATETEAPAVDALTGLTDVIRSCLDAIQSLRVDLLKEQVAQAEIMTAALSEYAGKVEALTAAIEGLPKTDDGAPSAEPGKERTGKSWL